jgi:hypothetical protein
MWIVTCVFAQNNEIDLKNKRWIFGIQTGVNYQNLQTKDGPKYGYSEDGGIGLNFGMTAEYNVNQTITFLPRVAFSFNGAKLSYGKEIEYLMPINLDISTYISCALAKNRNNPYLYLGPTYSIPFNSKSTFTSKKYLSIDIGLGLNQYFKKMIFCPELRYSRALGNVSDSALSDHLIPHTFSLLFGFKG